MNSQFDDMKSRYTSIEKIVLSFCESLNNICLSDELLEHLDDIDFLFKNRASRSEWHASIIFLIHNKGDIDSVDLSGKSIDIDIMINRLIDQMLFLQFKQPKNLKDNYYFSLNYRNLFSFVFYDELDECTAESFSLHLKDLRGGIQLKYEQIDAVKLQRMNLEFHYIIDMKHLLIQMKHVKLILN
ncbi:hypothetical protein COB28_04255 [Candidatus Dependentiae bacterium]|nr:MAG: hypothetical protein COB28_04255 [Candidatus Dependentiae bacterium]